MRKNEALWLERSGEYGKGMGAAGSSGRRPVCERGQAAIVVYYKDAGVKRRYPSAPKGVMRRPKGWSGSLWEGVTSMEHAALRGAFDREQTWTGPEGTKKDAERYVKGLYAAYKKKGLVVNFEVGEFYV